MRAGVVAAVVLGAGGCLASDVVPCADGRTCPIGTVCDDVHELCVLEEQVDVCRDMPDFAACTALGIDDGRCYDEVCLPAGCGNTFEDPEEACDDGNTLPGDGCAADCASDESCGNGELDPITAEQCDDGDAVGHDGCGSACVAETPRWLPVPPGPGRRTLTSLAYDAHRRRTVLFGGEFIESLLFETTRLGDTWEWDGARWLELAPASAPAKRSGHATAYDPIRRRVVLFGGDDYGLFGDTWELDGGTWTPVATTGDAPAARAYHAMLWDPVRERIVLHGGQGGGGTLNDTWAWDGETWTPIETSTPPPPRRLHGMAIDPARGVIVMYGGQANLHDPPLRDLWELDGATWTLIGPTVPTPAASMSHAMVADSDGDGVLMIGGSAPAETWEWDGTGWTLRSAASPPRDDHAAATDTDREEVLVYGMRNDGETAVWASDDGWTTIATDQVPPPRAGHAAAAEVGGGMIVYGGFEVDVSGEVWRWNGGWEPIAATPGPRAYHAMAFDEARGQTVAHGGADELGNRLDSTWLWDGTAWTLASPATTLPARALHAAAYDRARGRVVIFGGQIADDTMVDETWEWDGVTWTERTPPVAPRGRIDAGMAYDDARERVVLFGGEDPNGETLADTWEWDGVTWTDVTPLASPPPRAHGAMAWDPARQRVVMVGGQFALTGERGDVWEWDGTSWIQGTATPAAPARSGHVVFSAPQGAGVMVYGGGPVSSGAVSAGGDLWLLRWDGVAPYETCVPVDVDGDALAGCDDPDCAAVCAP